MFTWSCTLSDRLGISVRSAPTIYCYLSRRSTVYVVQACRNCGIFPVADPGSAYVSTDSGTADREYKFVGPIGTLLRSRQINISIYLLDDRTGTNLRSFVRTSTSNATKTRRLYQRAYSDKELQNSFPCKIYSHVCRLLRFARKRIRNFEIVVTDTLRRSESFLRCSSLGIIVRKTPS